MQSGHETPIEPPLYKIVYRSHAIGKPGRSHSDDDIAGILSVSRDWNAAHGITGALLLSRTGYAQVLEGPKYEVKSLFGHIICDRRHQGVELLYNEPHAQRDFGNWAMAVAGEPDQADIELASTAYQRDIILDNGAEDIMLLLRWLLIDEPMQRIRH